MLPTMYYWISTSVAIPYLFEAVLGLDLDIWRVVDLEMLGALVQRVLGYQSPLQSLAWVIHLGVVALGLVFPLGLVAQEFGYLLALEDFLGLVLKFILCC